MKPRKPSDSIWITVSDLMSGLVFVFIITLSIFIISFKKEKLQLLSVQDELKAPNRTRQELLKKLSKKLNHFQETNLVEVLPDEGILRLSDKVIRFKEGSAFPQKKDLPKIGRIAYALVELLPCYSIGLQNPTYHSPKWCGPRLKKNLKCNSKGGLESIMIEGHTDSKPIKKSHYLTDNLALSAERASTVFRLMTTCAPELATLKNSNSYPLFGVSGYSYFRPIKGLAANHNKNRRIDIRISMALPKIMVHSN